MRRDAELDAFLASGSPLQYLQEHSSTVASFRAIPQVSALVERAGARAADGALDGADEAIRDFLQSDLASVEAYFLDHFREAAADPKVLPPFGEAIEPERAIFHNVTVYTDDVLNITLTSLNGNDLKAGRIASTQQQVLFSSQRIFYKFLRARDLVVELWECDRFDDSSDMRVLKARGTGPRPVPVGELVEIDGTRNSISFKDCADIALFIQVENRKRNLGFSAVFSSETGAFVLAHPTSRNAMRKMVMCSTLRNLGRQDKIAQIDPTKADGPFYERWHFLREVTAAAPAAGRPFLEAAVTADPNPSVRRAAKQTLEYLNRQGASNAN
jgi:hypothetical protein